MTQLKADSRYLKLTKIGEGQYAVVYKAEDKNDSKIVAVKKIKIAMGESETEGINISAIREIKALKTIRHENIIKLLDVFGGKFNINLVYDYMELDLLKVIENPHSVLTVANIKSYLLMAFKGLEFMHLNFILHRDLKPSNLLIDSKGILKLGDFGLAKTFGMNLPMTSIVVTRWYRAPELLFGAKHYGTGIDIWSMGCIMGELLKREPMFPGGNDLEQLHKIFGIRGSPTLDDWPNMNLLPDYLEFKGMPKINLMTIFTAASKDSLQLMEWLLSLNPLKRPTCTETLKHPFFANDPSPTPPHLLAGTHLRINETNLSKKRTQTAITTCRKKLKF